MHTYDPSKLSRSCEWFETRPRSVRSIYPISMCVCMEHSEFFLHTLNIIVRSTILFYSTDRTGEAAAKFSKPP
jgi:hypothetical protein